MVRMLFLRSCKWVWHNQGSWSSFYSSEWGKQTRLERKLGKLHPQGMIPHGYVPDVLSNALITHFNLCKFMNIQHTPHPSFFPFSCLWVCSIQCNWGERGGVAKGSHGYNIKMHIWKLWEYERSSSIKLRSKDEVEFDFQSTGDHYWWIGRTMAAYSLTALGPKLAA